MRKALSTALTVLSLFSNFFVPIGVAASAPSSSPPSPDVVITPAWFRLSAGEPRSAEAVPGWFLPAVHPVARAEQEASPPSAPSQKPETPFPAWFDRATSSRPAANSQRPTHHTIYPDAVTVSGPSGGINNCDLVTFTIVATNDSVTTTGVVITSAMPIGFVPTRRVFNVGTVGPNETITRHAVFSATCDAVSGQNVVTLTQDGADPIVKITDFAVDPGAITVRKEPAVVPAGVGDLVTWTVIVRNSGYGRVDNVVVTDVLGSGLTFVAGQTSAYTPSLSPGEVLTFPVVARVDACFDLGDVVTATWGCPSGQCQKLWAKANVDLRLDVPFLDYSTPPFNVDYCTGSEVFTITVSNSGAGTAHNVLLRTDMSPFSVTVLSPGAAYTPGLGFTLPDITGSTDYDLVCELTVPAPCSLSAYGGSFNFQLEFEDDCGNPYVLPVRQESWQLVGGVPSLSISKESVPGEIYLGEVVSPVITVDAANLGNLVVTDTLPPGWSVLDADGGSVFTVGTTTYITWVVPGTTTTHLYPVLQSPITDTTGCTYCGTQAVNTVEVRGTDCQDCDHAAQATASTYIQCENSLSSRGKQVAPAAAETCTGFVYTNTYVFASSFTVTPTWQGMIFTDELPYQTYVPGSASIWISDGQRCPAVFSETVDNGMLVLTNISPTCAITVPGATMVVTYQSAITAPGGCSDLTFYDWSYLDLGVTGNSYCAADGVLEEGVFVSVDAPQMAVGVLGAPPNVEPCAEYTVTLTLDRLDAAPAYDVAMRFDTTDYAVVEVLGFGGATPVLTATGPSSYTWFYSDQFATATTATVQLHLQRRCDATGPLSVRAWYDGRCEDDSVYFEQCSVSGGANPPPLTPSLIVAKFPELIWAQSDLVTWTLTLINAGAGAAHRVVLTDTLGSGLRYVTSTITTTRGSVAGVTPAVSGGRWVTWTLDEVPSGAQVTLGFVAEVVSCEDLTNRFSGYQSCQGQMCRYAGPKTSVVELPETILLNTNVGLTPIEVCTTGTVTITVKNAGLMSVYSATITDTLPEGLVYLPGTTEYSTDQVHWQAGPDPSISGQTLAWGPTSGPGLGDLLRQVAPDETIYIRYQVRADCDYEGGLLRIHALYYDVCDTPHRTAESTYVMGVEKADLTITKRGRNLSTGGPLTDLVLAEPGESVLWVITVTNGTSAGTAYEVLVTDTLPWNAVFVAATTPVSGPSSSGTLTWPLGTLAPGATAVVTVSTVVSTPDGCDPVDTVNTAAASWGCPTGCRSPWQSTQALLRTRPIYQGVDLNLTPTGLHLCGDVLTVTLENHGTPAHSVLLTATLPTGLVYSETLSASTAPDSYPTAGDNPAVWRWTTVSLPTGLTTVTFRVRNDAFTGGCSGWSGSVRLDLTYDDANTCTSTGPYTATRSIPLNRFSPILQVDKQPTQQTADVGDVITWTITVHNAGNGTAFNTLVTDVVAGNYVNVTATTGSDGAPPTVAGNVITWTPDPIPPGGTWTAQVSAQLINAGANRNVVTATTYCGSGCVASTDSATAYLTLLQTFRKGPPVQTGTIGSLIVFTFTTYLPDTDALYEDVVLTDALPTGLGYVSSVLTTTYDGDGSATTVVSSTPTVTPGYLASGDVVWVLGDLPGTVQINGVLTAVVQDVPSNHDGLRLTNVLTMTYTDDTRDYVYTDTADVDVVEPILHLGKTYVTPHGCEGTLFEDNFNDGNATGWTGGSGWSVANGLYRTNNGYSSRYAGDVGWTDYSFSVMMRAESDDAAMGVYFRRLDGGNYYRIYWQSWRMRLQRRIAGSLATVVTLSAPGYGYVPGKWYHLEVRVEGRRIRVYVDGALWIDYTETRDDAPASGRIGLYSGTGNGLRSFDDVLVTRLGDPSCYVGANDLVTYTLVVSNQSRLPGYDLVITDDVPAGMSLVGYTMTSDDPTASVVTGPSAGATGVLTWTIDHLTPTVPFDPVDHTALTLTVVLRVSGGITANFTLPDQAFLTYDNWEDEAQPVGVDRDYSGGSHSAGVRTVNAGIAKSVAFFPPPTATLGTLVTYTLTVPDHPITTTLYGVVVTDTVDSRLRIEGVVASSGGSVGWSGQVVTAAFASIPHDTLAFITITARISHEWPSPAADANAGDVITDVAEMAHTTAPMTRSNSVQTVVGEPQVNLAKGVRSSTGSVVDLDGTALLTYTIRLTNTGSSPAYSLHITDAVPAGVEVLAVYGGDGHSGPVVGPGVLTWTLGSLSNVAPGNVAVLSYTARITGATTGAALVNTVDLLYHSLTETVPGVRPYTGTDAATVETARPEVSKQVEPPTLEVGDLLTYTLVFTVPAGTVGMGGSSYLEDTLPQGVWYITDSESLTWTPSAVAVTVTNRISTVDGNGRQVVRWYFGQPITSEQSVPTVITLTFRCQAVGLRADTLAPVWTSQTSAYGLFNLVRLWERGVFVDQDGVQDHVVQPRLSIGKTSVPPSGGYVGAGARITYTLTFTNDGYGTAYDIVVSDTLPPGVTYVTSSIASATEPSIAFTAEPSVGSTGVITWRVNRLGGVSGGIPGAAEVTVVAEVTATIGANLVLTNTAAIPYYDSQPGDGPGPYTPDEREYTDGSDSVYHVTVNAGILKAVAFSPPPTATLGTVVTYTLTVPDHPITVTFYNLTVVDRLDARLRLHAVLDGPDGTVVVSGNTFTVTYPSIPHGQQRFITVTAVISDPLGAVAGDVITNVAVLTHQGQGPTPSNVVSTTVGEPRVSVSKAGQVLADPQTALYTLTVVNQGSSPAYSLVVTDAVPEGLEVVSVSSGGVVAADGRTITWTLSFLDVPPPPDNTVVLTFTARLSEPIYAGRLFTNAVTVRNTSLTETIPGVREYITDDLHVLTWPLGRLGDYVWYDFDYDGVQGTHPGEFGIAGVVVELFDADTGAFITSTTTAADGSYLFDNLPLGVTYTVRISSASYAPGGPLEGYTQTLYMASGVTPATDSNASITQTFGGLGYAITTTLTSAFTEDLTLDYGFVRLVELGNYVWYDADHDGVQDAGEAGFGGVTVTLTYPDGRVFTTTTTANGYYTFTVPVSQAYTITLVAANFAPGGPLEAYTHTLANQGSDDGLDSDGQPSGGGLVIVTPVITGDDYSYDFGLVDLVSLGNQVWYDTDDSGTLDAGEVGVAGVVVELYQDVDGDGVFTPGVDRLVSTATTTAGGYYTFTRLYPSLLPTQTYLVVITETNFAAGGPLEGYVNSTAVYTGDSDLNDRDHGVVYGTLGAGGYVASGAVTVTPGDEPTDDGDADANSNLTIDFGFYRLSLGNRVWYDVNNNGYLDAGESGAAGIEVRLYDGTGTTLLMTTTTDASGYYTFTGLVSGTYVVEVVAPGDYVSSQDIGTTGNPDNNVDGDDNGVGTAGGTIRSNPVHLVAGDAGAQGNNVVDDNTGSTHNPTVDFGLYLAGDLMVVKSDDPDPVVVGTVLTYTFTVTNNGPSVARNVVVTDTLPPEVVFLSATPAQSNGPNPLVWTGLGDLDVGASLRFTVTVRVLVTATDVFTNVVVVGSDTPDYNADNNVDEEPTTPLVPALRLVKTVEPGRVTRNQPLTYTIRITNNGDVTFDPLVLTDTLPPDFHYIAGSGSPADPDVVAEPTLVWQNLGPLAPGRSLTVTFAVTATPSITGTYVNVATATGTTPGPVLTDTDSAPVEVVNPAVVIEKRVAAVDLDIVEPNFVTFTILVTNVGPSAINVLPLQDLYDDYYLSFVNAAPYPEEDADDGDLAWYDLTGPAPNGFDRDLLPGETFVVTTVFRVVRDITTTINTAVISGVYDIYDNPADRADDDAAISDVPTAIGLRYFQVGDVSGRSVRLEWATAVEVDTFGFNLYRASEPDRARASLLGFVPSQGHGSGAVYEYTDTVPYDGVWWYWLADVDTSGGETFHGPVSATVGGTVLPYRIYLPIVVR